MIAVARIAAKWCPAVYLCCVCGKCEDWMRPLSIVQGVSGYSGTLPLLKCSPFPLGDPGLRSCVGQRECTANGISIDSAVFAGHVVVINVQTNRQNIILHCVPKSEPPKHFATATANLHRVKWNFTHTRRHLFSSSTSNFRRILIPFTRCSILSNCCHKSQLPIQLTSCWRHLWWQVWGQCVLINKQHVIKKRSSFNKNAESWKRIRC